LFKKQYKNQNSNNLKLKLRNQAYKKREKKLIELFQKLEEKFFYLKKICSRKFTLGV
jgi:hypothetical protein